jgi:hypothetical protein
MNESAIAAESQRRLLAALRPLGIDRDPCSDEEWQRLYDQAPNPPLVQSLAYGRALAIIEGHAAERHVARRRGEPVALLQWIERPVLGRLTFARLMRGPVWLVPPTEADWAEMLELIRARHRWRRGRFLFFLPELEAAPEHTALLEAAKFQRVATGYASIALDLTPDESSLRRGLAGKWRNALVNAERHALTLDAANDETALDWLLERYEDLRRRRRFAADSPAMIRQVIDNLPARDDAVLLRAIIDDQPVAGILLIRHGRGATYLVGWTSPEGRRLNANHLLLWRGLLRLRAMGVTSLDLGGVDAERAPGVARFKLGLGGRAYRLAGAWI